MKRIFLNTYILSLLCIAAVSCNGNRNTTEVATRKVSAFTKSPKHTTGRQNRDALAWLSERYVTSDDLYGLSPAELRIYRNYIFARHGYIFSSKDLTRYFSRFDWYVPTISDPGEVYKLLNPIEKYNISEIKSYE